MDKISQTSDMQMTLSYWQRVSNSFNMIDKLDATCEQYGMAMNAKKTKTMIVEKTPEKQCEVNLKGQRLTQVKQYIYLGTTIEHTGQCKTEVVQRINQVKIAFWKKATILKSNISMKTRIRILMCYVFSVLSYGCETWTYSKAIDHKINAFEMWCYRRMLRISWTSHTTNIDVLQKIGVKETTMLKFEAAKHTEKQKVVLCGPHNEEHIRTL